MYRLENKAPTAEPQSAKRGLSTRGLLSTLFFAALLIGIVACLICDRVITGGFGWSQIAVSSIAFAWAVAFPAILLGKKGMPVSLLSFSALIFPYLLLLSLLTETKAVFSIGAWMAAISVLFLWIIVAVWRRAGKAAKERALGMTFLLAIPFLFTLNAVLSKLIAEPLCDGWDALAVAVLLLSAVIAFACGYARQKNKTNPSK